MKGKKCRSYVQTMFIGICALALSACSNVDKKENKETKETQEIQATQQISSDIVTKNQESSRESTNNPTNKTDTTVVSDGKDYIWERDKELKSHYIEGTVYSMSGNEQGNAERVWINIRSKEDSSKFYRVCTNEYEQTVEWVDKSMDKEGGILGKKVKVEYQGKIKREKDKTNRLTYDENGKQVEMKSYEVIGVIAITQEDAEEYVWKKDSKLESHYIDGVISEVLEQKDKNGNIIRTRLHIRPDENPLKLFIVYTRDCKQMAECIRTTKGDWKIGTKIKVEYQGEIEIMDSLSQRFQFQPKEEDEVYEVKGVVSIVEEEKG